MELLLEFGGNYDNYNVEKVTMDGLCGREPVTSLKDSLYAMRIRNPSFWFNEQVEAGEYEIMDDGLYGRVQDTVECICSLWRYPEMPEDSDTVTEMNILMLLANAIRLISRQEAKLREYRKETGEDGLHG